MLTLSYCIPWIPLFILFTRVYPSHSVYTYISQQFLSGPLDKQQRRKSGCHCRSWWSAIQNNTENWRQGLLRTTNLFICPIFWLDQTSLHQGLEKTTDRRVEFNWHLFLYYLLIQVFSYCIPPPIIFLFKLFSIVSIFTFSEIPVYRSFFQTSQRDLIC